MDVRAATQKLSALTLEPAVVTPPAKRPPQDIRYKHAHSLLQKALHQLPDEPPGTQEQQAQLARQLYKAVRACDVSLVTTAGVQFRVHSPMLVHGPEFPEAWALENEMSQHQIPRTIALPQSCHPILIDRMISFLYTGDYPITPANGLLYSAHGTCNLYNAYHIPNHTASTPDTLALMNALNHKFHLHMYALASTLQYPALKIAARDKLWDMLYTIMRPSRAMSVLWILRECIDACYSPLGSDTRLCPDEDGLLQETIVAAVLAHEVRTWDKAQREGLKAILMGPVYEGFWEVYHGVTAENAELLTPAAESANAGLRKAAQVKREAKAEKAQKRRNRKEIRRKGLALIEEQEAADLAALMAANPDEEDSDEVERHEEWRGGGLELSVLSVTLAFRTKVVGAQDDRSSKAQVADATLSMNAEVMDNFGAGNSMANPVDLTVASHPQRQLFVASGHGENACLPVRFKLPGPAYVNLDAENEMRDGLKRMRIDDLAQE